MGFSPWFEFPARLERKLDEILRAVPDADNSVISLEHAPEEQLDALSRKHRAARAGSQTGKPEASSESHGDPW